MSTVPNDGSAADQARADQLTRRRLEGEIFILQSDRSQLERQSNEIEAEVRMLEKAISDREIELDKRKADRDRLIQKIQDIDAEIVRIKRASYK